MGEKIKLTINKVLYESDETRGWDGFYKEETDNYIKTILPRAGEKGGYIWFDKKDIVMNKDGSGFMVEIDPDKDYGILANGGNPEIENRAMPMRTLKGDELYEQHYEYKAKFDPTSEASKIAAQNKAAINAARANRSKTSTPSSNSGNKKIVANYTPTPKDNIQSNNTTTEINSNVVQEEAKQDEVTKTYSKEQFEEIKRGVRNHLDIKKYSNVNLNAAQMKELRLGLKDHIDVSRYNNSMISAEHMKEIRLGFNNGVGVDIDKLDHLKYNASQMKEIRLGYQNKLSIATYLDPRYSAGQMREMRLGLKANLNIEQYSSLNFSAEQMKVIRHSLVYQSVIDRIKQMFISIRDTLAELTSSLVGKINNKSLDDEMVQQIIDENVDLAVEDIKDILQQSELDNQNTFNNEETYFTIKDKLHEVTESIVNDNGEENKVEESISNVAAEILESAGIDMVNDNFYMNQEELDLIIEQELRNAELEDLELESAQMAM